MAGAPRWRPAAVGVAWRRQRAMAVLTVAVAVPWVMWAHIAANHVRQTNTTRFMAEAILGSQGSDGRSISPLQNLLRPLSPATSVSPRTSFDQDSKLGRRTGWVESIAGYWEWCMYVVGAELVVTGVLAACTRWSRVVLKLSGAVIVLATVGTLLCLHALTRPTVGDLPRLSVWTYCLIGIIQGGYGLVLLQLSRRPRAMPGHG